MPEYARHKILTPVAGSNPDCPHCAYPHAACHRHATAPAPRTLDRVIPLAGQTPSQIMRILRARIEQLDRETDSRYCLEYCAAHEWSEADKAPIREGYRWAAVFPVTGGSEGHYLHVVAIYQRREDGRPLSENHYREIGTIKLFGGWDAGAELAGIVGKWMDA